MRKNLLLSLTTGVLLSLAFPPLKFGFLAYIALIPLFFLLEDKNYKESIRWGFLTGLFINLGTLYWISWVTVPGAIAAILYLPIYVIIYSLLHTFIRLRLGEKYLYLCVPFLWTGVEYLRALGVLGFPWCSLAYTQSYYLSLIQYVSFSSVYGVSFWVVTINVIILYLLRSLADIKKIILYFVILITLFVIPWIYGKIVVPDDENIPEEKIRVALIQGNIDPYLKWDDAFLESNLQIYEEMTRKAAEAKPQLIIWPETAVPDYLRISNLYLTRLRELLSELNTPLITGAPDFRYLNGETYETYNAAFLLKPNSGSFDVYHKIHLVPFGERVPFTESIPFLKDLLESLEMGEGNFSPGHQVMSLNVPVNLNQINSGENTNQRSYIGVPVIICFESLFPEMARKFIQAGADILVIITNDAWFKKSAAPFHHAQIAVFRAIENRVSIARCANTGVSMFIDPYGRTQQSSRIFEKAILVDDILLKRDTTFFTKYGNVFTIAITLLNIAPLIAALFFPRKHGEHTSQEPTISIM
jgi:apolipoprotein N-acyltransferase